MASPQVENGYTRIANELLEAIIATPFSGQELRIIFAAIRKTYGWNKNEDYISLSQFARAIGTTSKRCSLVINRLVENKVFLFIDKGGFRGTRKFRINKDYNLWTVPQKEDGLKRGRLSPWRGIELSSKKGITKDTVLKTLTKDTHQGDCDFETEKRFKDFWALYPDRNGRKADQAKEHSLFVKLPAEDQTFIIRAVKNYAADEQILRGVGILDPANFIRRRDRETGNTSEPWRGYAESPIEAYAPDRSWHDQHEKETRALEAEREKTKQAIERGELKLVPRSRLPFESEKKYAEELATGRIRMVPIPVDATAAELCKPV